jgi:hypothetical protein
MRRNGLRRGALLCSSIALVLGCSASARAQLKGHYIPGFTGLSNGSQGPPGINVVLPIYFYTTDTIKDDAGTRSARTRAWPYRPRHRWSSTGPSQPTTERPTP